MGSFLYGYMGNKRSNIDESFTRENLGASESFRNSQISSNHYMTYLYLTSPLANLQENIDREKSLRNENDAVRFIFYSLIPPTITRRAEKILTFNPPDYKQISPYLIVGSYYLMAFMTFGWAGMIILVFFLLGYITVLLSILPEKSQFYLTTLAILSTSVAMLIFDNFLIRLDVILMLFGYPLFFYFLENKYMRAKQ